jgi:hypothetical protein
MKRQRLRRRGPQLRKPCKRPRKFRAAMCVKTAHDRKDCKDMTGPELD